MIHVRIKLGQWASGAVLSLVLLAGTAQAERVTLRVALAAGRDPNVNIVQDYGNVRWSEVLVQEFQKEHPNVDVEFVVTNMEKVTVEIAAGIGADIINGAGSTFVGLGRLGAFVDLAPLLKRDGIDYMKNETFWEPQWKAFQYKGVQFALPQYLGTMAMYYNADMFDNLGIPRPPASLKENAMDWQQFESLTKKLTRDVNGDSKIDVYGFNKTWNGHRVGFWMLAAGAQYYVNDDVSRSGLNAEGAVKALEYLQNLRWNARTMPPPGVSVKWEAGQVAIHEEGSWALVSRLGVKQNGEPKVPFTWNVFPMPKGPSGQRATMATIDGYAINRNTKHLQEAYALVKFLAGPTANAIMARYVALQPANRAVVPEYIRLMRAMNRNVYDINVHVFTDAGPYASPQYLYSNQEAAETIIGEALRRVIDDNEPARPVWMEAMERLNRVLATELRHVEESTPESVSWGGARWTWQSFNVDVLGGAAVRADGKLALSAAGWDMYGNKDGFGYLFQRVKGNFTATVRLHNVMNLHAYSKAGLMVRSKADASAPYAMLLGTSAKGLRVQYRAKDGAATASVGAKPWTNGTPIYLRLTRNGKDVTASMSYDGTVWTTIERARVELGDEVLVGLALSSHVSAEVGEAVFSDWELVKQ